MNCLLAEIIIGLNKESLWYQFILRQPALCVCVCVALNGKCLESVPFLLHKGEFYLWRRRRHGKDDLSSGARRFAVITESLPHVEQPPPPNSSRSPFFFLSFNPPPPLASVLLLQQSPGLMRTSWYFWQRASRAVIQLEQPERERALLGLSAHVHESGRVMKQTRREKQQAKIGEKECGFGERVQARVRSSSAGERERWKKTRRQRKREKSECKKKKNNGEFRKGS